MRRRIPQPGTVSEDFVDHPAAQAWLHLHPGSAIPSRIDEFHRSGKKKRRKSAVFRLHGVRAGGATVIAKSGRPDTIARELQIYELFLSRIPISQLRVLGSLEADDDYRWLFLEDGGDRPFLRNEPEHRSAAARWLASLHTGAAPLIGGPELPDRGPDFYHRLLRESAEVARETRANPALARDGRGILDQMERVTSAIETRWAELTPICGATPSTLVHGDFIDKNVKLGADDGGRLSLFVFDWEMAGLGSPAVDIATSNWGAHEDGIRDYLGAVREHWHDLTATDLRRLLEVGRVFRLVASIRWACEWLRFDDVERRLGKMSGYLESLAAIAKQPV